jgi:hypothetical protein
MIAKILIWWEVRGPMSHIERWELSRKWAVICAAWNQL